MNRQMTSEDAARAERLFMGVQHLLAAYEANGAEVASVCISIMVDVFLQARPADDAHVASEMRRMAAHIAMLADVPVADMRRAAEEMADVRHGDVLKRTQH